MQAQRWSFAARLWLGLAIAAVLVAALSVLTMVPPSAALRAVRSAPSPLPQLRAAAKPVRLLVDAAGLSGDAAPVVRIGADGEVQLLRPETDEVEGSGPAILLPDRDLRRLSPRARGALLECLGALLARRPVRPEDVVGDGGEELERLLSWVR